MARRPHFFSAALGAHKNDSGFWGLGLGFPFFWGGREVFFEWFLGFQVFGSFQVLLFFFEVF